MATSTTYTRTICTIASTTAPQTTVTESYLNTYYTVSIVNTILRSDATCADYWECENTVQANPDIAGLGVILAFLITAYVALIPLLVAYWYGFLPPDLLRTADRRCFFAHSRRCHSSWTDRLEKITIIFADQQLATGLSILIAGYYEVFARDLDVYHWQIVIYLAWLSSIVHLIALSVIRRRLNETPILRNIRLFGMLLLAGLLAGALVPTTTIAFETVRSYTTRSGSNQKSMPTRCLWSSHRASYMNTENSYYTTVNLESIFSYILLFGGYIWKLCQLFDNSRNWLSRWARAKPEALLERAAKRCLVQDHTFPWAAWLRYRLIVCVYVYILVCEEVLESFMATMIVLALTLTWGTMQLFLARNMAPKDVSDMERTLSFGQVLALLLLLQPAMAVMEDVVKSKKQPSTTNDEFMLLHSSSTLSQADTLSKNLRDALTDNTLLTADQKLARKLPDPMVAHVFRSRVFRVLIWSSFVGVIGIFILIFRFGPRDLVAFLELVGFYACGAFPLWFLLLLPFSRKLR